MERFRIAEFAGSVRTGEGARSRLAYERLGIEMLKGIDVPRSPTLFGSGVRIAGEKPTCQDLYFDS